MILNYCYVTQIHISIIKFRTKELELDMEDLTSQDLLELDHRELKQMEAKVTLQVLSTHGRLRTGHLTS